MKTRRFIICFVSLFALTQNITASDELRERFLSLRSRSNSLRRAPTLDDLNDQPTESTSTITSESAASSTATFEPQTTAASLRRKQFSGRKPNLRLGVRNSSDHSQTQVALTAEGSSQTDELPIFSEPEVLQESTNAESRGRARGAFGNHRFRPNTFRQSDVLGTINNNENFEPEPKIVELPPSAVPLVRRPHIPRRIEKEIENVVLTPDETLPLVQNPTDINEMKQNAKMDDDNLKNSQVSDNISKVNSPLSKFEPSEAEFTMPFSFKHEPRPNPNRGSFKTSETKKPFLEKKTEFKINTDQTIQNKTSKISPIKNFYEAQRFLGNDGDKETLETSETRTRSKIEIKEVNGTLFEYEYIYYYDDEAPLYDYDAPAIADEIDPVDLVNQFEELTTMIPKPKATTTTTTTKTPTTTTTTTTPPPPPPLPPRIRQRPTSGRGRTRQSQNQETQEVTQEIVAHKESFRSPPDLQQNVIPEVDSRLRGRLTQSSRQPSRSRGNSRALVHDSAPAENIVHDVKFEEQNLPAHTRFPPRATPPTQELEKGQEFAKKNLDEHLGTPLILGITGDHDQFQISEHIQPELATETFVQAEFEDEVTTADPTTRTDASVANLYALSKVVDADFEDATTGVPIHDIDTPSPTDYESLYDYDITLGELEELDFMTTVDYDLTTEKITTTSTTTTTTTPASTTTITTTEATTTPVQGRGRLGGARTRGQAITRPKGLSRGQPEVNIEAKGFTEKTAAEFENIPPTPVRPGGRLTRPDIKNRGNLRTRGQQSTLEHDTNQNEMIKEIVQEKVEEEKTKITPSRRPISNVSRPRPSLGGRFKPKTHVEETAKEAQTTETFNQVATEEQTTEAIKPATVPPRTRRPSPPKSGRPVAPPKSGLSRFNRLRPSTSKLESSEPENQEQNNNSTTTPEPLQISTTEKSKDEEKGNTTEVRQASLPSRKPQGGKHRFNLPNKFSRTRPVKETVNNKKDLIDSKTSNIEDLSNAETATSQTLDEASVTTLKVTEASEHATPINRKGTQKPRDNRFKVPNGRTRTRGRGIIKAESETKSSDDQGAQMAPVESGIENEAAEPKTEVTTQVAIPGGSNLRTRTKGQSRSIPNERKEKNVSKTGLSSLFRKSGLLKQNEETKESVVTNAEAAETPAEAVRNPFDALADLSGTETDGSPQSDNAAVKETGSETAESTVEGDTVAVDTTEDEISSADEKLTRRKVLASRRSQFLG